MCKYFYEAHYKQRWISNYVFNDVLLIWYFIPVDFVSRITWLYQQQYACLKKKHFRLQISAPMSNISEIFKGNVEEYSLCSLHCTDYKHVSPKLMKTMVCMYIWTRHNIYYVFIDFILNCISTTASGPINVYSFFT